MVDHNTDPLGNDGPKTVTPTREVGLSCASGKDISSAGDVTHSYELPGHHVELFADRCEVVVKCLCGWTERVDDFTRFSVVVGYVNRHLRNSIILASR